VVSDVAGVTTPILETRDLDIVRDGRLIVHVDRLTIDPGEIRVVLGANGSGKTTMMRALNTLTPSTGEILFRGEPVKTDKERMHLRRHTAAVFQQAYLLNTTVQANVETGLRIRGVDKDERRRRAGEALEMLGVAQLAGRQRDGLSGGEAQRVSIARAIAVDPAIIFLDEPTAALDPPTRRDLLRDLERIFRELRTSVMWVTHDIGEALAVADRIAFIAGGRLLQDGSPDDLLVAPANKAVADFLGVDSWLEGEVRGEDDGRLVFRTDQGGELLVHDSPPGPALVCIRPDDVLIFREQPDGGKLRNLLPVKVSGVRPVGRHWRVSLLWGEDEFDAVIDHDTHAGLGMRLGDEVWALVDASLEALPRETPSRAPAAEA
jgi:tungstate transport system ATP-binding protein